MIREIRDDKITRDDVYARYFDLTGTDSVAMTEEFREKINRARELFGNKQKINVLIRGAIFGIDRNLTYYTFVDETFSTDKFGLEEALSKIDNFGVFAFSKDETENNMFFSVPEQSYVSNKIVASAQISITLE